LQLYVALFPGYQLIYGAFAAFPLGFLIWVYNQLDDHFSFGA